MGFTIFTKRYQTSNSNYVNRFQHFDKLSKRKFAPLKCHVNYESQIANVVFLMYVSYFSYFSWLWVHNILLTKHIHERFSPQIWSPPCPAIRHISWFTDLVILIIILWIDLALLLRNMGLASIETFLFTFPYLSGGYVPLLQHHFGPGELQVELDSTSVSHQHGGCDV